MFTRLTQFKLSVSAGFESTQQVFVLVDSRDQLPPAWSLQRFGGVGSWEVIRVKLVEFTRLKQIKIWLCGERTQPMNWCSFSMQEYDSCLKDTQLSLSPCVSGTLYSPPSLPGISQEFFNKNHTTGPGWPL